MHPPLHSQPSSASNRAAEASTNTQIDPTVARRIERCLTDGLHLVPLLLRWLRPQGTPHANGLEMLITTLRNVLQMLLPISFNESTDEDRRRRVSAILTPLLDAVSERHAPSRSSLPLLSELMAMPSINEQPIDGDAAHPFTEGVVNALRAAVGAAIAAAPLAASGDGGSGGGGGGEGGGSTPTSACALLWMKLCHPALANAPTVADGTNKGRWHERYACVRWLGLPFVLHTPQNELIEKLLSPTFYQMLSHIKAAADKSSSWLGMTSPTALSQSTSMLHSNLARVVLTCEIMGAFIGRLGKDASTALKPQGRLSIAYDLGASEAAAGSGGSAAGTTDCFKLLVGSLNTLCALELPIPNLSASAGASSQGGGVAFERTTSYLLRQIKTAAYSALLETIVQTQTVPTAIAKALCWHEGSPKLQEKYDRMWDGVIDGARKYELKASTEFDVADDRSRTALHALLAGGASRSAGGGGSGAAGGGGYLPSQALLQSSLSQDVDLGMGGDYGAVAAVLGGRGGGSPQKQKQPRGRGQVATADGGGSSLSSQGGNGTFASQQGDGDGAAASSATGRSVVKSETPHGADGDSGGDGSGGGGGDGSIYLVDGYELDDLSTHPIMSSLLRTSSSCANALLKAPSMPAVRWW